MREIDRNCVDHDSLLLLALVDPVTRGVMSVSKDSGSAAAAAALSPLTGTDPTFISCLSSVSNRLSRRSPSPPPTRNRGHVMESTVVVVQCDENGAEDIALCTANVDHAPVTVAVITLIPKHPIQGEIPRLITSDNLDGDEDQIKLVNSRVVLPLSCASLHPLVYFLRHHIAAEVTAILRP